MANNGHNYTAHLIETGWAKKEDTMFKKLTLTAAALAASASFASADSYISNFVMEQDTGTQVMLGTVRAEGAGVVEVYGYHLGQIGELLGTTEVSEGANLMVDVDIIRPSTDAIVFLKVDGMIVDMQEIDFNN